MKLIKKTMILAAALFAIVSANAATVNYSPGDLIIGFTTNSGQGAGQVLMVSLGSATAFRDATTNNFSITTIGVDLEGTFGANWYDRTDLYWGAIGVYNSVPEGDTTNGDLDGTVYVSKARGIGGTAGTKNSTTWNTTNGDDDTALTRLGVMQSNFDTQTASDNNANVAVFDKNSASWDKWNPPVSDASKSFGAYSSTGVGIQQKFTTGSYDTILGNGIEGALDLYRNVYHGAAGYEGTLTINQNGDIGYVVTVPEPSTYALIGLGLGAVLFFRRRLQQA
ncbi:PEP-CTERM protein-sorting domain-containing protein [Terrimicrobium sacchariphilum]|uniref:PEP-CTERM protein-sorting domain-containing protein n=1 Tax=Terrimicrobium sacchariphilum TaxID=690879 RepID=A0A146GCP9_TERSA|nr:PEP-CTERM sorting domain-containing protein [Terrimicrobium sacchariphilum]GAT34953.1 PEP-CTERM protein-sorting domain-containing protein [Terrimicrobium sacchariphilum]